MTQQEMMTLVPRKLEELEREHGIRILYAAESGSRAWGTHSERSDFDVRFIYIRPREDYLRLVPLSDVLEFPIEEGWDLCGWDLCKTLRLLHNANSQIYEWFASPVVYRDEGFSARFRPVLERYFSVRTASYHYLHQALLKVKKMGKAEDVKVKHYLYILQHLSAVRWILERKSPVPVSFSAVTELLPGEIREQARALLHQKTTRPQEPLRPRIPTVDRWIGEETERIRQLIQLLPEEEKKDWELLDRFLLRELDSV